MKMKWKYYRDSALRVSKWVSGNNWVTKYDGDRVCILGINGNKATGFYIASPKEAREFIETGVFWNEKNPDT